ncbi:ATP-dependent DNA helicase, RecQ family [Stanieria cyanosphaera PCC 7437]|uniref:ATP-dependent DNA helicase RecQ n=1 Tax=Stanieria cyanosphaera (strain ATCC 29371 / PCC 7437) TaxID=111780 RepID=K9XUX0_STAC7|nr:ATP-dependent DNA helicase RecQ [Stanieria cyanosphaera]AFZ35462.1 ATP-dependent DNA helicase, RecQ family [Stanieria cyanosphaera PCC 7437]
MSLFNRQLIQTELQKIWGYQDFRYPQAEIIDSFLTGKDVLIVMPTGGGKSICFQLPALLQTGLTLIVSPLVALMENQVNQLQQKNLPAALIHSELSREQKKQTLQAITRQKLRLVYLSPETLLSPSIWEIISQPQIKINGLVLDEAHCLVQWGTTFRPAYTRLGIVRPSLLKHKPPGTKMAIAAFTATADPLTQKTITQQLQLDRPEVFLINPYRANLNLQVKTIWTPRGRKQQVLKFIGARKNQAGLVYVRSRRDSEELTQWLRSIGYAVQAYHAGLPTQARRTIEQDWLTGKIQFTVCTSAFGMGIDKSDVRWIVHFHAPELLSEYMQEVGRGGRDGKPADALTLISEPTGWFNPEDKQRSQFFTQKLEKQYLQAKQLIKQIPSQGEINAIARQFSGGDLALSLLYSEGLVRWQDPFTYQKQSTSLKLNRSDLQQQAWQKQRHAFLQTKQCRWQFLLAAFGFSSEAKGFSCGHCDNCLRV